MAVVPLSLWRRWIYDILLKFNNFLVALAIVLQKNEKKETLEGNGRATASGFRIRQSHIFGLLSHVLEIGIKNLAILKWIYGCVSSQF